MDTSRVTPARRARLRRRLLAWFDAHQRDLPWRRTRDPWRILISEAMLQQTRVETVIPYYARFVAAFPTPAALAGAPVDDVLRLWAGLGYYSRARNLKRAAEAIGGAHRGAVPRSAAALGGLPGIGPYIAGAVASIAFGERVPAVDGNVLRVLARVFAIQAPIDASATRRAITDLAAALVPAERAGDFNQALMELGALVCAPRAPRCPECPLRAACRAYERGVAAELPTRAAKRKPKRVDAIAAVIRRRGKLLMVQRPPIGLLAGMWTLPSVEVGAMGGPGVSAGRVSPTGETPVPPGESEWNGADPGRAAHPGRAPREVESRFCRDFGLTLTLGESVGVVRHLFTHVDLRLDIRAANATGRVRLARHAGFAWATPRDADAYAGSQALPLATLDRRALDVAMEG